MIHDASTTSILSVNKEKDEKERKYKNVPSSEIPLLGFFFFSRLIFLSARVIRITAWLLTEDNVLRL